MSYHVTKATEDDIPDLLKMIQALADYEKEPDANVATPELMRKNMFENRYAESLIVRYTPEGSNGKGEAVGMALYFFSYSTWLAKPGLYLEDLFVAEEHRGKGWGKRLFSELGQIAKDRGCARMEWRVLKWNKPSIDFYVHSLKAESLDEWDTMRLEGDEAIERLIAFKK